MLTSQSPRFARLFLLPLTVSLLSLNACKKDKDAPQPAPPAGPGTSANTVTVPCAGIITNTTWANVEPDSTKLDYIVTCELEVSAGVLTIAPGVRIRFDGPESGLSCRDAGGIKALGTALLPITFESAQLVRGAWAGLRFNSRNADNTLTFARVRYAGSKDISYQTLGKAGVVVDTYGRLTMNNSRVETCSGTGVIIDGDATLSAFAGNVVRDCELNPVLTSFKMLGVLGINNRLTGNGENAIRIYTDGLVTTDNVRVKELGVPCHIHCEVYFRDGNLTLDPGVTLAFASDASLQVYDGTLTALGTVAKPITLRGLQAGQGTWMGLSIGSNGPNRMDHCVVDGGGAARISYTDGKGGIVIGIFVQPGRLTISNSTVRNSLGHGISKKPTSTLSATTMTYSGNELGDVGNY